MKIMRNSLSLFAVLLLLTLFMSSCSSSKKTKGKKKAVVEVPAVVVPETEETLLQKKLAAMSFSDSTVVKKVQVLLYLNAYNPGKADGTLKPQTEEALLKYQTDHNIAPNDRSKTTLAALGAHLFDFEVQDMQRLLEQKGYDPGPIDNIIGPMTRTAYLDFLNNNGLGSYGLMSKEITTALFSDDPKYINQRPADEEIITNASSDVIAPVTLFVTQIKIADAKVMDVQRALQAKGYDAGAISINPSPQFKDALYRYQVDKQLPMGGMNEETLRSLGFKD